jgi:hypothetical protein
MRGKQSAPAQALRSSHDLPGGRLNVVSTEPLMMPAWKPWFASPNDIVDVITQTGCTTMIVFTVECELELPVSWSMLQLSPKLAINLSSHD